MNNGPCRPCMQKLNQLMEIDFVLVELLLYLDTHPNDSRAMREFCSVSKKHQRLMREYQDKCAMITVANCKDELPWRWIEEPWPWEIEY